jgi:hypothetical protein
LNGSEVGTIEGLDDDDVMRALRAAFSQDQGLQCGFCTPKPKIGAVIGEAEFIDWVAAYAHEHTKLPARGLSDWKLGRSPPGGPDVRPRGEYGEVSSLREVRS